MRKVTKKCLCAKMIKQYADFIVECYEQKQRDRKAELIRDTMEKRRMQRRQKI